MPCHHWAMGSNTLTLWWGEEGCCSVVWHQHEPFLWNQHSHFIHSPAPVLSLPFAQCLFYPGFHGLLSLIMFILSFLCCALRHFFWLAFTLVLLWSTNHAKHLFQLVIQILYMSEDMCHTDMATKCVVSRSHFMFIIWGSSGGWGGHWWSWGDKAANPVTVVGFQYCLRKHS